MNKKEAHDLLLRVEADLKKKSYSDFCEWISKKTVAVFPLAGASGAEYEVSQSAAWDSQKKKTIRVTIALHVPNDEQSSRHPDINCFIIAPDGSFIDE